MTDNEIEILKSFMTEEWKQLYLLDNYQNYDISNFGRVRNHSTGYIYKPSKTKGMKNTYEFINIKLHNGRKLNTGIHRLVAIMFIPIPSGDKKFVVDHIDNIKYHNIYTNLQWLTESENIKKSSNFIGPATPKDIVKKICELLQDGHCICDISIECNCSELLVRDILYKIRYKKISKDYTFPVRKPDIDLLHTLCEEISNGSKTIQRIASEYKVSLHLIKNIKRGQSHKDISKDYIFPRKNNKYDITIIRSICSLLSEGISPAKTAKKLGIPKSFVQHIASGDIYEYISDEYTFNYPRYKIPDDTIISIYDDAVSGKYLQWEIAKKYNVSQGFVKSIKGKKYRKSLIESHISSIQTSLTAGNSLEL